MKIKDIVIIVFSIITIIIVAFFYIKFSDFSPKEDLLLEKISKLEHKVDSLNSIKDSIRTVVDSTHVKIITNEKHYQERINTIITQSSSADSSFITDYIRQYSEQDTMLNSK